MNWSTNTLFVSSKSSSRLPTKFQGKLIANVFLHRGMTDISGSTSQNKAKKIKIISQFMNDTKKLNTIHHDTVFYQDTILYYKRLINTRYCKFLLLKSQPTHFFTIILHSKAFKVIQWGHITLGIVSVLKLM